ncbi:hypothetical protein MTQ10_17870 [Streptomyces sp. XM83C]|jgi:hypothetical protein|uniref:DUF3558 domain-containing protein n=1 Tax=Streptomyces thermocoprophilus TaxID=78356 RepID=A0ABV5VHG4_9ACTN|nr:hypothetical protein [Streptomyces sp. XM83C]MCK1821432.1 hypothetical protein [Streptomyces sp. XM83C]
MMHTRKTRALTCALTAALALSLAACDGGREYTVLSEACGIPLDEAKLDPFLVDGKEMRAADQDFLDPSEHSGFCSIIVDSEPVAVLRVDIVDKVYDPMDPSEAFRFTNRKKMDDLPFEGLGALGDNQSMVSTDCKGPEVDALITYVSADPGDAEDIDRHRSALRALTLDLVPKVKKKLRCTV